LEDISALINQILSDPNSVQQLQQAAASLGLMDQQAPSADAGPQNGSQQAGTGGRQNSQSRQNHPGGANNQHSGGRQNRTHPDQDRNRQPLPEQQATALVPQSGNVPNVDLSALSRILEGITRKPAPAAAAPDLSALAGLLGGGNSGSQNNSGPDLSALAGLLGGGNSGNQSNSGPDLSALSGLLGGGSSGSQSNSGPDLSALAGLLGGGNSGSQNNGSPDLSALSGLLGGLGRQGGTESSPANSSVTALANMLGGQNGGGSGGGMLGGIDMNMLLKAQKAMSALSANQDNARLLLGLKSHLKTDRAKKVDDAVRVMQLIQFLPLIKETGLFGGLEDVLGSFGLDGVGGMLGNIVSGKGLGGLLSGLNLTGGR